MKLKDIFATLGVFRQLETINGMPIKFVYALVKNITAMETVESVFQKLQTTKVDGQQEMEDAKLVILQAYAKKDESGKPMSKPNQFGQAEYDIENWDAFKEVMDDFRDVNSKVIDTMEARNQELADLLEDECEEFEPYMVDTKFLPQDEKGNSTLSAQQLRYTMPFLTGDSPE